MAARGNATGTTIILFGGDEAKAAPERVSLIRELASFTVISLNSLR